MANQIPQMKNIKHESDLKPVEILASEFNKRLSEVIGDENIKKAVELNSKQVNKKICHTHDFCDANEVMADAFHNVFSKTPDIQDDATLDLINTAWDLSKSESFGL